MKTIIQKLKKLFAKISGNAKSSANKAAETPAAQEAAHTATTAMSESVPMSGLNKTKIFKTTLSLLVLRVLGIVFSVTIFGIYFFSANCGKNPKSYEKMGDAYNEGNAVVKQNKEKAKENYEKAYNLGNYAVAVPLASLYDRESAISLLEKTSDLLEKTSLIAPEIKYVQKELGKLYDGKDYEKAFKNFERGVSSQGSSSIKTIFLRFSLMIRKSFVSLQP